MGRPKTSTNTRKRDIEIKRTKERRKDVMQKNKKKALPDWERSKTGEYDFLRKEKSHKNQSRQKIQGIKLKDNNRKRKQCHPELYNNTQTPVNINSSTERVIKHRQKIN